MRPSEGARPSAAPSVLQRGAHQRLPARIAEAAGDAAGVPVAVYVIDVDGSCLHRLAGDADLFPALIGAPLAVGPELPPESLPALGRTLARALPGSAWAPLALGGRALGVLIGRSRPAADLAGLAEQAALALELGSGYTDVVHAARRSRHTEAAAEIQQNLLPPRLARVEGADLAGGVLPGYEVGGDFFDYAENHDGLWLAIADAVGKGSEAAALASLAVGALRATRRSGGTIGEAAEAMHEAVVALGRPSAFVTAVLAVWHAPTRRLRWITCGHPRPVVLSPGGEVCELTGGLSRPLGLLAHGRAGAAGERTLPAGARLLLYSDGVSERLSADGRGLFGLEGIADTMRGCRSATAAGVARALQDAVTGASDRPLRDDVTVLVLALDAASRTHVR